MAVAVLGVILGTSATVSAAPTPSSSDIENQINKAWASLEPTIENYDAVSEKLAAQKTKAAKLQSQIAPLALQVQVSLARVGGIAANLYMAGPSMTLSTMLNSSSGSDAFNVLGTIEQMATDQRTQVDAAVKLQKQYEAKKKPIDELVAQLSAQQTSLNQQKAQIQTKITSLDKQRLKAFGTTQAPGPTRPVACPQVYTGDAGSRAAAFACTKIGKKYVWDTAGPNTYDCSGLTMASWKSVGVTLPHNANAQKHSMPSVSRKNLKPGDLVFYYPGITHVTIYVGNGWVVSAPTTGDVVRMKPYDSITPVGYGRP
jgi:cell wall-associated NlpC family hydrolase